MRASPHGWLVTGALKLYPFAHEGPIQAYASFGIGVMEGELTATVPALASVSVDDSSTVYKVGLGTDYYVHDNWAINTEASYVIPTDDLNDFRMFMFSMGVVYRF